MRRPRGSSPWITSSGPLFGAVCVSLALLVFAGTAQAAETEFLFDALHGKTPYRASWEKLMKLVQPTPDWLMQFNKNFDGVSAR